MEEYLVDVVLELAVGVGEEVLDDLVVVLIGRGVGDVEMELHMVGAALKETDALILVLYRAGLGHHIFDHLAVHAPGDVLLLRIFQLFRTLVQAILRNDLHGIVDVELVVRNEGEVIPKNLPEVLHLFGFGVKVAHNGYDAIGIACTLVTVGYRLAILDKFLQVAPIFG